MATLLLTSRSDGCSDRLVHHLRSEVVRLNLEDLHEVGVEWTAGSLTLDGKHFDWSDLTAVLWRKPSTPLHSGLEELARFDLKQRLHLFRSVCAVAQSKGIWMLIDPLHESRFPKPLQLTVAQNWFRVPDWSIRVGAADTRLSPVVSKAFAPEPVKGDRGLTTRKVDRPEQLDPSYLWFLQRMVAATHDATVVYCRGRIWSFKLTNQRDGSWVDWRPRMANHLPAAWQRCDVTQGLESAIRGYMEQLGLNFGRLDFLVDEQADWWFLEVNPNGQFGWLDPDDRFGVYSEFAKAAENR